MSKVTVLGGGGWAIALAKVLNENGHNVTLWSALEREVEALTKERENKVGLPGVKIPEKIKITNDIKEAVKDSKMIVMAVASSFVRSTSELLKDIVPDGQIIVDVAKGIEDGTFYTMTEVIEDVIPTVNAVVLSGPSHAEEVGLQFLQQLLLELRHLKQQALFRDFSQMIILEHIQVLTERALNLVAL